MDIRKVDFAFEGRKYQHGLAKYWLFEDIPSLTSGLRQIVQMNQMAFNHDWTFGNKQYKEIQFRDLKELFPQILDTSKYD